MKRFIVLLLLTMATMGLLVIGCQKPETPKKSTAGGYGEETGGYGEETGGYGK